MTYWLLTVILANGTTQIGYTYGSKYLCNRAAHGAIHRCIKIYYGSDR
jgi:hypothetical protein